MHMLKYLVMLSEWKEWLDKYDLGNVHGLIFLFISWQCFTSPLPTKKIMIEPSGSLCLILAMPLENNKYKKLLHLLIAFQL